MKRYLAIVLSLMLLAALLAGCGGTAAPAPATTQTPAATQAPAAQTPAVTQAPAAPAAPAEATPEPAPTVNPLLENYPNKPITIVVPSAAGSGYDTMARKLAEVLPKYLNNATIIVENLKASSGAEGFTKVYNADPDGYTLCFFGIASNSYVTQKLYDFPYKIEELTPLCSVTNESGSLSVSPDSDIQSMADFMDKFVNQGQTAVFSTSGAGGATHNSPYAITTLLGIDARFVHYGSSGEAITALGRNETECFYIAYETGFSYMDSGMMRCICLTGSQHMDSAPGVPTIYEVDGISADIAKKIDNLTTSHRTMWAPPGMDTELRDYIVNALEQAFTDPEYLEWAESVGRKIVFAGGDEAARIFADSYAAQDEFLDLYRDALNG